MLGGRMSPGVLGTCATLLVLVQAGPLLRFARESEDYPNSDFSNYTANEVCFSDQKVFQRGEEVPNAGPCEECRCEPPSIVCQMLKCPVNNNGCRTIQRPNHCCPDYNCECDYNNQLYNDGERIDLPEDPCQVCYCKGGDVMCTSITCYQRDDCEPKHVPGQCCPKFEDCPIRDMEASNTEDKNVQTRSPNKTMNSNPKKEMQPWLLTKSVPQTSSSLAVPKLGETTTDSGNVIIVSDWLVERRTTEDVNTKQTEDPDFSTHREFITTIQPQKLTQVIEKENNYEKNMQTVKPTPVDEVVFTRIDIPKRLQEETIDSLTTTGSTSVENTTSHALKLSEIIKDVSMLSENTTLYSPSNLSNKNPENISTATQETNESSSSSTLDKESETESMTKTSSSDSLGENILIQTSTIPKKVPIKFELKKDNDVTETSTTEVFEAVVTENSLNNKDNKESNQLNESKENKFINTDSITKSAENVEMSTNPTQGVTVLEDKDKSSEEMTLEHLFGLQELEEDMSTKQIPTSTEKYSAGNTNTPLNEQQNTVYTILPEKIEKLSTVEGSKDDSLKNKSMIEIVKLEETNHAANNGFTNEENGSHSHELLTTKASYGEEETTTAFASELNVNKQPLQYDKFVYKSNEKYGETTYPPETTTEIETTTLLAATFPEQLNDEAKENVLDNLIEGKQEDKTDYSTNIDTTTSSNTENGIYTIPITLEHSSKSSIPQVLKTKDQLQSSGDLTEGNYENDIQEESSHSYTSKVNNGIKDSTSTSDFKQNTKDTLSEIEIILGETNNTNVLDKSISSQESNEQDEAVLDLAFDEISSENKEVVLSNHPPVLELNSHVPFLQIGGDGNSDPSDTEYDLTTAGNIPDFVDDVNKKPIHGDKEILQLTHEDTTNSSLTVSPSTTTVAASSSTKEPSSGKTEEFTIPTIAVVPLTPGDLKMIAEYLISEKIKPTSSKNNSIYSANQWLKGNLTSEENIASILSAANVSIGLMNETSMGRKLETFSKSNNSVRLEKLEKETRHKSNSIIENKNIIASKTDSLHDKNSDSQESFKTTVQSQEEINNHRKASEHFSSDATSDGMKTTEETSAEIRNKDSIQNNKSDALLKSDKDFLRIKTAVSNKTDQKVINEKTTKSFTDSKPNEPTTVDSNKNLQSVKIGQTNNPLTEEKKMNVETSQISSKVPVTEKSSSYPSTISNTDHQVINKQTNEMLGNNKQNESVAVDDINQNVENKIRKTDNLETREQKTTEGTTPVTSRTSFSDKKPSDSTPNNKLDTTTSKVFINKPSHEEVSS